MHHLHGALSETRYIYERALIEWYSKHKVSPKTLIVGLGLGYLDFFCALYSLNHHKKMDVLSFEIETQLIKNIFYMLEDSNKTPTYQALIQSIGLDKSSELLLLLKQEMQHNRWKIKGEFSSDELNQKRFDLIFYDPFSSKTNQHLWDEVFLTHFIKNHASQNLIFVSFAATGALNRALKNSGMKRHFYPGFGNKREFTYATRAE